ncbi:U6 snRNA (guanine-N(2))-methyltransferase THUMPD2-like [Glandiceps talaboti]
MAMLSTCDPSQDMNRPVTSYFATTGRGLEEFLAKEIKEKLNAQQVKRMDGKVFFSSNAEVPLLKSLKTAERLMVNVDFRPNIKFPYAKGKCRRLIRNITEEITTWENSLEVWKEFQEKQGNIKSCDTSVTEIQRKENALEGYQNAEEMDTVPDSTHTEKKLKSDDSSEKEETDKIIDKEENESSDCKTNKDNQIESRTETHTYSKQVDFRISCKCTGKIKYIHSPQEFAINMGTALAKKHGWSIELRKPKLDISVHVCDEYMLIGLPVTFDPLSRRQYIKKIGIRSTIAWCMCHLADIQSGHVVLDPMCGTGTVLLEAAMAWKGILCIGGDNNMNQLTLAKLNIQHAKRGGTVNLVHADVKCLPMKDSSVDCIVSDIPFGLNHSTFEDVKILYPIMQREMNRVIKPGGRAVLLTSGTLVDFLIKEMTGQKSNVRTFGGDTESSQAVKPSESPKTHQDSNTVCDGTNWTKLDVHYLKIALVHAYICVFKKREGENKKE